MSLRGGLFAGFLMVQAKSNSLSKSYTCLRAPFDSRSNSAPDEAVRFYSVCLCGIFLHSQQRHRNRLFPNSHFNLCSAFGAPHNAPCAGSRPADQMPAMAAVRHKHFSSVRHPPPPPAVPPATPLASIHIRREFGQRES